MSYVYMAYIIYNKIEYINIIYIYILFDIYRCMYIIYTHVIIYKTYILKM